MYSMGPEVQDRHITHLNLINMHYGSRGLRQTHNSPESYKHTVLCTQVKDRHITHLNLINIQYGSRGLRQTHYSPESYNNTVRVQRFNTDT